MRASHDGAKKNELAQIFCASSIQYSIRVAGYWTWKPPGPPRKPVFQPFPSFKLKGSLEVVASHHTAVVPFWDAAAEVVSTTQYLTPFVSKGPDVPKLALAKAGGAAGAVAFTAGPSGALGTPAQASS